ncbi:MAG TPA: hypothetical protein VF458_06660, partial [Ktedonobacteraceae bacterium]
NQAHAGSITGGADVVVALKNITAVQELIKYMATAQAQEIWVKRGGFTSPNKSVNPDSYPDAVSRSSAQQLAQSSVFRFGADDMMPYTVERVFWQQVQNFVADQRQLDIVLNTIEMSARQNYGA